MKMNVIIVYNQCEDRILMCLRSKEPYKGLYNLVGGKVEAGEGNIGHMLEQVKLYREKLFYYSGGRP